MSKSTFSLSFICRAAHVNKLGIAPIQASIIVNGKRVFLNLPKKMNPDQFKKQMNSPRQNELKCYLSDIYSQFQNVVDTICKMGIPLTAANVRHYFTSGFSTSYTVKNLCDDYLNIVKIKWNADEIEYTTFAKYRTLIKYVIDYFGAETECSELLKSDIQKYYLQLKQDYKPQTASLKMRLTKTMWIYAFENKKITDNPFTGITINKCTTEIATITPEEYIAMRNKQLMGRLARVRDLAVFACNCGMSFIDIYKLQANEIKCDNGQYIVEKSRQKTNIPFYSVILPDGVEILKKYDFNLDLLKMSNQKFNAYLKEIQTICNITSIPSLTCHKFRHYYITSLVRANIPIAIVAKCAGHANIKMTEHYLHLTHDDIISAFKK